MKPTEIIPLFDTFLDGRGLKLEAIVTGGAALALLGIINRETRDCDLIAPELSVEVQAASVAFAEALRQSGEILRDDWLNNGPASLGELLPMGWRDRLQPVYQGRALRLWTLGRLELLLSKLFALCDRGLDMGDCLALCPSPDELAQVEAWIVDQDLHPDWPAHVRETLQDLAGRLGHGL